MHYFRFSLRFYYFMLLLLPYALLRHFFTLDAAIYFLLSLSLIDAFFHFLLSSPSRAD